MTDEEKEKLKQQRIANLKRGREEAEKRRAEQRVSQSTATPTKQPQAEKERVKPPDGVQTNQQVKTEPSERTRRPLTDLFGRHNPNKGKEVKKESVVLDKPDKLAKQPADTNIYRLVGAIGLILLGGFLAWFWNEFFSKNAFMFMPALGSWVGAYFLIRAYLHGHDSHAEIIDVPLNVQQEELKKKTKGVCNALCIYPNLIQFEVRPKEQLIGQPQKCLNLGKYFYVLVEEHAFTAGPKPDTQIETASAKMKPFVLPDQRYYDPGVFATRVLELPAHRRILRRKETLIQKLQPVIIAVMIPVFAIIMVMTLGG